MVANTGTYLDAPFHRYADGDDLAGLDAGAAGRPCPAWSSAGRAKTGWRSTRTPSTASTSPARRCWSTPAGTGTGGPTPISSDHPFLTASAARLLVDRGARLVGIDSHNIDDTRTRARPVHTILLGAGIPICEHMTNLGALPDDGFAFTAVPPKIDGMGTFPVRAFALHRLSAGSSQSGMRALSGSASARACATARPSSRVGDPRPPAAVALDHHQAPVDLAPPVHPRRILLADEAALGEADAVQFRRIALQPEQVAEFGAALADAKPQAVLEPAAGTVRPAGFSQRLPEFRQARIGDTFITLRRPMHGKAVIPLDPDRPPQPVDGQPLDEIVGRLRFAIDEQIVAVAPRP